MAASAPILFLLVFLRFHVIALYPDFSSLYVFTNYF